MSEYFMSLSIPMLIGAVISGIEDVNEPTDYTVSCKSKISCESSETLKAVFTNHRLRVIGQEIKLAPSVFSLLKLSVNISENRQNINSKTLLFIK